MKHFLYVNLYLQPFPVIDVTARKPRVTSLRSGKEHLPTQRVNIQFSAEIPAKRNRPAFLPRRQPFHSRIVAVVAHKSKLVSHYWIET